MTGLTLRDAIQLQQSGRVAEALRIYQEFLDSSPTNFDVLCLAALAQSQMGNFEEAQVLYSRAAEARPHEIRIHYYRGIVLEKLGRREQALASIDAALAIEPTNAMVLEKRAELLLGMNRAAEALVAFDQAIALTPNRLELFVNRCMALIMLQRYDDALAASDDILARDKNNANGFNLRGLSLSSLGRYEEAIQAFDRAGEIAVVCTNRALALLSLGRTDEAIADFTKALAQEPDNPQYLYNRGNAFCLAHRYDEAIGDCTRILEIAPDIESARGNLVRALLHCCEWGPLPKQRQEISARIAAGQCVVTPMDAIALSDSAEEQLRCAEIWGKRYAPVASVPMWREEVYHHDRIRVAYLSADFRPHPVAYLMAGVFEQHDRTRFHTTAIALNAEDGSPIRKRLESGFDEFVEAHGKSAAAIAALLREREIDIAVDLMGFTVGGRPDIFAARPAPIQVNYLGYPGTMGVSYVDYLLADGVVVPEEHKRFYREKVVWLPRCYMPYDPGVAPGVWPGRGALGLPEQGFVFASLAAEYKITPEIFGVWMRVLGSAEASVLWLRQTNTRAENNLRRAAAEHGIDPERLCFAPWVADHKEHLARLPAADLFLDTSPYGAHSTAADALAMGVPVLTLTGRSFASRVAASLLTAAGLSELITGLRDNYEQTAIRLARDADALSRIRDKLVRAREAGCLPDTKRTCRSLEEAYIAMWERRQQAREPISFAVEGSRGAAKG